MQTSFVRGINPLLQRTIHEESQDSISVSESIESLPVQEVIWMAKLEAISLPGGISCQLKASG